MILTADELEGAAFEYASLNTSPIPVLGWHSLEQALGDALTPELFRPLGPGSVASQRVELNFRCRAAHNGIGFRLRALTGYPVEVENEAQFRVVAVVAGMVEAGQSATDLAVAAALGIQEHSAELYLQRLIRDCVLLRDGSGAHVVSPQVSSAPIWVWRTRNAFRQGRMTSLQEALGTIKSAE